MKNFSFLISFLLMLPILSSCKGKKAVPAEKPDVEVDVMIAGESDFLSRVEVNGSALSEEMIELHPEISGRLTYLNIPDGAYVSQGTILAKINDAELQAQLEQQKVQLELAIKTEERLRKLLAVNGVNQSEYDISLNQLNSIHANINVLNAQIDKTVTRAAFNGILGLRMVSPGAYVTPQTLLGTLQQADKIKIDFTVPETYVSLVKVGNVVSIITNGSEERLTAVISAVEPQINPETRNLKARARLISGKVSPGAFVKVIIDRSEKRILVPSNAIIPSASSNQVIIIKKGKAGFADIETGLRNADAVEILKGLQPGDTIVVSGVLFVRPGATVTIRKVIPPAKVVSPDSN